MENTPITTEKEIHFLDYLTIVKKHKLTLFLSTIFIFMISAFIVVHRPKVFTASTQIKVLPEYEEAAVTVYRPQFTYRDHFWLENEVGVIKSDTVMSQVVKDLNLINYFAETKTPTLLSNICKTLDLNQDTILSYLNFNKKKNSSTTAVSEEQKVQLRLQSAVNRLKNMISIKTSKKNSLIILTVSAIEDPSITSKIANAVAKIYNDNKINSKLSIITSGLKVIEEQVASETIIVDDLRIKLNKIRAELKIPTLQNSQISQFNSGEIDTMRNELAMANVQLAIDKETLDKIEKMSSAQLEEALGIIIEDSQDFLKLKNLLNESILEYKLISIDFAENHPEVQRSKAKMQELRKQMDERLDGVKNGFLLRYEKALAKVNSLQRELNSMIDSVSGEKAKNMAIFNAAANKLAIHEKKLSEISERLSQEKLNIKIPRSGVSIISSALTPFNPSSMPNTHLLILCLILSVACGTALAFIRDYMNLSIKTINELEEASNSQVLAAIPNNCPNFFKSKKISKRFLEEFRILYTNLSFVCNSKQKAKVITFVSCYEAEGKSSTLTNVAYTCANAGKKVLIIDADLHRPTMQNKYDKKELKGGLIDLLIDDAKIDDVIVEGAHENIKNIHAGLNLSRHNGINQNKLKEIIDELYDRFDIILIDSPPLFGVNDSSIIASVADITVMVVKYNGPAAKAVHRAFNLLKNCQATVGGVVFSRTVDDVNNKYYSSYYNK